MPSNIHNSLLPQPYLAGLNRFFFIIQASLTQRTEPIRRSPHYENALQFLSLVQPSSPDSKPVSSLEVKEKKKPLLCDKEETFFIKYTIAGESQGSVDVMYLVSSG